VKKVNSHVLRIWKEMLTYSRPLLADSSGRFEGAVFAVLSTAVPVGLIEIKCIQFSPLLYHTSR